MSVDFLAMILLGGIQSVLGPVAGAAAFHSLKDFFLPLTDHWRLFLGLSIIAMVLVFPRGLAGAFACALAASAAGMTLLAVEGLTKRFGGVLAARDVSFALDEGEMLAIIGPNGAGKSTTFNMVGGQLRPDGGAVTLAGQGRHRACRPARCAAWAWGARFQVAQTFLSFSVLGNVQMALLAHHGQTRQLLSDAAAMHRDDALALLDRVGMAAQADRPIGELAYGDVKRVELAIALAAAPRLLLMDEPTAGMAPAERAALMALVAGIARSRTHRRAVHRTRHGRRLRACRPHPGAGARRDHRARNARRGARRPGGAARLSRPFRHARGRRARAGAPHG